MALGQRNHLYQKEMEAETNWRIAKDEVQRNYNLTYHMLQLTFPDNLQLVESFFSKLSKRPSTGDQEEQNPVE